MRGPPVGGVASGQLARDTGASLRQSPAAAPEAFARASELSLSVTQL